MSVPIQVNLAFATVEIVSCLKIGRAEFQEVFADEKNKCDVRLPNMTKPQKEICMQMLSMHKMFLYTQKVITGQVSLTFSI